MENTARDDARTVAARMLQCIGAKDLDGTKELFADDIDWFVPGSADLPWTGRHTRRSEAPDVFAVMWPHYVDGKSSANVTDIHSDGNNVVIIGTFSHVIERSGRSFTTPMALHLKVDNGKISHLHLYEDTLLISQAFGAADGPPAVGRNDLPAGV